MAAARAEDSDVVQVWFQDTSTFRTDATQAAATVLSDAERSQAARFHFERDRRDYTAAHALVRQVLARCDGRPPASLAFGTGAHGKPYLLAADGTTSRWEFSLSHTDGMVACAVAGRAVGVDVERLDRVPDFDALAASVCSTAERERLAGLEPARRRERFIELWTLKEALLKATGVGVSFPIDQIGFDIRPAGAIALETRAPAGPHAWAFALLTPSPSHRLAVAVRRQGDAAVELRSMRVDDSILVP
jgi:4'-phosphopantetheinyl transferase